MRKSRINPISKKKQAQIEEEYPLRIQLCNLAGGNWIQTSKWGGYCSGGTCAKCNKQMSPAQSRDDLNVLHPHEKLRRSRGGKLSLENSRMLCPICHSRSHGLRVIEH